MMKCQKYSTYAIFLKTPGSKDIKTDIPNRKIHKYKFTNTGNEEVPEILLRIYY